MTSLFILLLCICLMFYECVGYRKSNGRDVTSTMKVLERKARWGRMTIGRSRGDVSISSSWILQMTDTDTIVSPFAPGEGEAASSDLGDDDELELTRENVELVLDEMRPFLKADGGDVALVEIDGPVVKLELQGACGSCPSSSMTMKMGLERKLKEKIPEIAEVVQTLPDVPEITTESVEKILDSVRPFLAVAGGKISISSITGVDSLQPLINLKMEGSAASLQSVKLEIMQRIQRHFMQPALKVEWVDN